jgi:hypothetical protein
VWCRDGGRERQEAGGHDVLELARSRSGAAAACCTSLAQSSKSPAWCFRIDDLSEPCHDPFSIYVNSASPERDQVSTEPRAASVDGQNRPVTEPPQRTLALSGRRLPPAGTRSYRASLPGRAETETARSARGRPGRSVAHRPSRLAHRSPLRRQLNPPPPIASGGRDVVQPRGPGRGTGVTGSRSSAEWASGVESVVVETRDVPRSLGRDPAGNKSPPRLGACSRASPTRGVRERIARIKHPVDGRPECRSLPATPEPRNNFRRDPVIRERCTRPTLRPGSSQVCRRRSASPNRPATPRRALSTNRFGLDNRGAGMHKGTCFHNLGRRSPPSRPCRRPPCCYSPERCRWSPSAGQWSMWASQSA